VTSSVDDQIIKINHQLNLSSSSSLKIITYLIEIDSYNSSEIYFRSHKSSLTSFVIVIIAVIWFSSWLSTLFSNQNKSFFFHLHHHHHHRSPFIVIAMNQAKKFLKKNLTESQVVAAKIFNVNSKSLSAFIKRDSGERMKSAIRCCRSMK
jgi:hypothetical protein